VYIPVGAGPVDRHRCEATVYWRVSLGRPWRWDRLY